MKWFVCSRIKPIYSILKKPGTVKLFFFFRSGAPESIVYDLFLILRPSSYILRERIERKTRVKTMDHLEIERKYLIRMPKAAFLNSLPSSSIEQVYILSPEGKKERIRRRDYGERTVFTHTAKTHVSDLTRVELEREIGAEEYKAFLRKADPQRRAIRKTRYLYEYARQCFEIDVFPFWEDRALMELELKEEEQEILLPDEIEIVREVTADKRYTNSALAREIPCEELP